MTQTVLSIRDQGLKLDSRADVARLLADIDDLQAIEDVCVTGNSIGPEAAQALADALKQMTSLKTLNMADICTGRSIDEMPASLFRIFCAVEQNTSLRTVDISDNTLGERVAFPLGHLITQCRSVHHLNISKLDLGPIGGALVAHALRVAGREGGPSCLRTLKCSQNRLGVSTRTWGEGLGLHGKSIVGIDISRNGIKAWDLSLFMMGLAHCTSLRYLSVQDSCGKAKDKDGWQDLANSMRNWPQLAYLNVADCGLDTDSFSAIVDTFASGASGASGATELLTFILDNNSLNATAWKQLRGVLEAKLPNLRLLSLYSNDDLEGNDDIDAIREVLQSRGGELILNDVRDWSAPDNPEWLALVDDESLSEDGDVTPTGEADRLANSLAGIKLKDST